MAGREKKATSAIPDELCCCIQAEVFASKHEAQREKQASFGGGGAEMCGRTPALQAVECFGKICQRQPTFAAQILECERIPD